MFTGIITDVGKVKTIVQRGDTKLQINTSYDTRKINIGASICCSGTCLTVIDKGGSWFSVEVSNETLSKTILGLWEKGTQVNLERSMTLGDEFGGHIVTGHVDGVGVIKSIQPDGDSHQFEFITPSDILNYIAQKGSITVNGVSLTVNKITENTFTTNIIPHTKNVTNFNTAKVNDSVNLEIDLLSRYVARLLERN